MIYRDFAVLDTYLKMGISIIPLAHKSKNPLVHWKQYQSVAPTIEQVFEWFKKYPDGNVRLYQGYRLLVYDLKTYDNND